MDTIRVPLASESHPSQTDHHYTFSPECLDRMAEQVVGLPVTVNFEGDPVGTVVAALRTPDGVSLDVEVERAVAQRIGSPAFRVVDQEWNGDFTERTIRDVDLRGIGFTDG